MNRLPYVRPTTVTVNARRLENNWKRLASILPPGTRVLAIVKANAYGHGSVEITQLCERFGAAGVGVADVSEAIVLRDAGYRGDILCLGATAKSALFEAAERGLILTLHDHVTLPTLADFAKERGVPLRVHVKVETGMHRLGLDPDVWRDVAASLAREKSFRVEGIFTHLAESDAPDVSFTARQLERFRDAVRLFEEALGRRLIRHAANSGGALRHPSARLDWVRPGIALYGYPPVPEVPGFEPVLEWKAPILQIKRIGKGDGVSYNRQFRAERPMAAAAVAVGYGDGYRRGYGTVGVGFRGRRTAVVGAVCMDMMMIDVTAFENVRPGEEVHLISGPENGGPDARELARAAGTVPYEVLTGISARVSRQLVTEESR